MKGLQTVKNRPARGQGAYAQHRINLVSTSNISASLLPQLCWGCLIAPVNLFRFASKFINGILFDQLDGNVPAYTHIDLFTNIQPQSERMQS